ncbi:MAG TPA: glycoside hydrolase N-terminal domain-containing protein [Candidatus Limnocylindrales bacterium]|nr:glycoside hydrolase N-terminal domain-containing protein [Candidatus Limnocylindrales bacterium]
MPRSIITHWNNAPAGSRGQWDSRCRYPGVPLAVDIQKRIGRHRLVYRGPAAVWQEGLPLGNGDLAAMVFQPPQELCWGLTKPDVRDLRHPVIPWVKHEDFRRLFEQGRNHLATDQINEEEWDFRTYFPSFLPAGGLWLDALGGDELAVKQQTLDLYHATHTLELANGGRIESFVYADGNVLAIRFQNLQGRKLRLRLSPEAVEPGRAGDDNSPKAQMIRREIFRRIQRQWLASQASLQVDYADGNRTLLMLEVRGGKLETDAADAESAIFHFKEATVDLLLTIVTAREGAFLHRRGSRLLETAWQRNFERLRTDHQNFWHERWSRSVVQLPERVLEALWCFAIYTMASSSRGAYPAPLMSAWNLRLDQPYGGDYHNNINSQMCYWPLFASNQCDLVEPYLRHFWSVIPEMETETRRVWSLPGIKIPFASIGRGKDHWGVGYWRYELFVSAWVAQITWWHYEFTGDRETLKQFGWPLIRGVAEFYLAYLEPDPATGKLCLPLTKLCEDTMFNVVPSHRLVRDAGTDLAAVHGHLRDAACAAEALGLRADAKRFRKALSNLNPVPVVNGEFAVARGVPLDVPVSHPYQIIPIYPTGLVTQLGPEELIPIARRTLQDVWRCSSRVTVGQPDSGRLRWNDDLSMGWLGVARAWMGDGDGALDALLNGWVTSTLKTNGFLTEQSRAPQERQEMMWMQNQLCGLANGVNEMLLQSHSDTIHVFPALPSSWKDVSFVQLRARPSVLVSAQRAAGVTRWVVLSAHQACHVKLRNPWSPESQIVVTDPATDAPPVPIRPDKRGDLILSLAAEQSLLVAQKSDLPAEILTDAPEDKAQEPWSFIGPVRLRATDPQPDGTWTSWWGKP